MPQSTHKTILIASALMGGQQFVRLLLGVVQSKIVAVLLGRGGTGVFGVYSSLLNLWQAVFGLGLSGSGVRQIAASDERRRGGIPSGEIRVQLWFGVSLGVLAGGTLYLFRHGVSRLTFGDDGHAGDIVYIAAAAAVTLMSTGLVTSLQGLRRIRDLTLALIWGAVASALMAVLLVWARREQGVAPAYLAGSACTWLAAWWFFRRIRRQRSDQTVRDVLRKVLSLVKLGAGFLSASLFVALTAYAVRALLVQSRGLDEAGLYQAAWMLSTYYCTTVLQAMGTDFLPRISAAVGDRDEFNRQINDQTETGLMIAAPGILLCMVAAEPVLRVLYTREFTEAVTASRWMMGGMLVRSSGWPLAYVPLAFNKPLITSVSEGFFAAVLIGLSAVLIPGLGLNGAGIAFFLSSFVYTGVLLLIARRRFGFAWSGSCRRRMAVLLGVGAGVFGLLQAGSLSLHVLAWCVALVVSAFCGRYAVLVLRGE